MATEPVKDEKYLAILKEVVTTKATRGTMYREEPKDVAPIEALEGTLLYKVIRAYYSNNYEKKRDELVDIINYATFVIQRIDAERTSVTTSEPSKQRTKDHN